MSNSEKITVILDILYEDKKEDNTPLIEYWTKRLDEELNKEKNFDLTKDPEEKNFFKVKPILGLDKFIEDLFRK